MLETQNFHKVLAVVITKLCTRRYLFSECAFCQPLHHFPNAHALYCAAKVTHISKFPHTNFTWRKLESWSAWTAPIQLQHVSVRRSVNCVWHSTSLLNSFWRLSWKVNFVEPSKYWIVHGKAWNKDNYVSIWSQYYYSSFIIIRVTHTNVWESMGKPCSCIQFIKAIFLQVTTSHVKIHIRYCKSRALRLNVQWNRRFVW